MQRTIEVLLATPLVAGGTVTVGYPAGFDENHFAVAGHKIAVQNGGNLEQGKDFGVVLNKTSAVVTLATGAATIPAGSTIFVELRLKGNRSDIDPTVINPHGNRISRRQIVELNLGAPLAASTTGVTTAQILADAGDLPLSAAVDGKVVLDVPRNFTLTVATTNQSSVGFTVTGVDEYGNAMVETIAGPNANTVAGKKAFKEIHSVTADAAIATNGVAVGYGDVLGLPAFVSNSAYVLKELEDGGAASAGTVVAGVSALPTGTTGDVRGTYDPASACDGAKNFALVVALENPEYLGASQYTV